MHRRFRVIAALVLMLLCAPALAATCSGSQVLPPHNGKSILLANDTLFFKTNAISLDLDGSPRAYGVRDQGLDSICNGLAPLRPIECKGKNKGVCFSACTIAFREWNGNPATLGKSMCSIGLGGSHCSKPQVRLQSSPDQAWFVSETSVHPKPPADAPSGWRTTQAAQLDSLQIPYYVITGGFRKLPYDATPGDVGIIVDANSGRSAKFIIGDSGGSIAEASAKLLATLQGMAALPTKTKTSAMKEPVQRMEGALSNGDYRVAIFRHTSQHGDDGPLNLSIEANDIPAFIETTASDRLAAIGGISTVIACTAAN